MITTTLGGAALDTAKIDAALRQSHARQSRIHLTTVAGAYSPDAAGDDTRQPATVTLPIVDGTLTIDGGSGAWRRLSVTVPPTAVTNVAPVLDGRADVEVWAAGQWVHIARLRVAEVSTSSGQPVTITAYDYANLVADMALVTVYAPKGTQPGAGAKDLTFVEAIKDLITIPFPQRPPGNLYLQPEFTVDSDVDATAKPAAGTTYTGDRWGAVSELANGVAAIVRNDHAGRFRIQRADKQTGPVWDASAGDGGVLVDQALTYDRANQYNAVALTCSPPTGGSLFVHVVDNDPASPTFYLGPFGKKSRAERNDTITDRAAAIAAARALLGRYKGEARSVRLTTLWNPLLEPFDRITVAGGTYIVDQIDLPLTGGTMTITGRLVQGGL